jgi:hypothetical protein
MWFQDISEAIEGPGKRCPPYMENRLKIKILVLAIGTGLIIFCDTEIGGADWKFLQKNFQGEFFYDAGQITRSSENAVGIWLKIVYSAEFIKEEGFDELKQTIGLWEINCKDKKVCLLSTSHHSKEGEISAPQVWLPPEWKAITPGTIMDALYQEFCK